MKRVILFLVFATLMSQGVGAQNSDKNADVDIRALVSAQIAEAQKKMQNSPENAENGTNFAKENLPEVAPRNAETVTNEPATDDIKAEIATFVENTKKNIWTKLTKLPPFKRRLLPYFIMIELFLIGTILAVWLTSRRSRTNKKRIYNLKETVRKMREERLGTISNPEISELRSGLTAEAIRIDDGGRELVRFAKKRGISKGELLLALKVKTLANKHKR